MVEKQCELTDIIFAIPTSSAASERAWSIFITFIQAEKQTVRGKVETLAYFYINYDTIKMMKLTSRVINRVPRV
ncbi:Hypothetical protein PHPALM_17038 [Phytophthora palmivora]|uniref:HAT C-terminal dimerisation domain-containing protein n=1 Tax=Phytophthora palmivora TaxID=4796 RepID=A0A2P4XN93_9STRA|nr:Hypothetical protein PHPALM_17038 [Phytophthora palmivora]